MPFIVCELFLKCQNSQYIHTIFSKSAQNQHFPLRISCSTVSRPFPFLHLEQLWSATNQAAPQPCLLQIQAPAQSRLQPNPGSGAFSGSSHTACPQIHWKGKAGPSSTFAPALPPFSVCGSNCPPQFISCPQPTAGVWAVGTHPLHLLKALLSPFYLRTAPPGPSLIPQSPNPAPSVSHFWASPLRSFQRD